MCELKIIFYGHFKTINYSKRKIEIEKYTIVKHCEHVYHNITMYLITVVITVIQ